MLPACSRNGAPDSFFDAAGYHVREDRVYYLQAFPGKASEIDGADAASFHALDRTFAKDRSTVYVDGRAAARRRPASFVLLDRPDFARDGDARLPARPRAQRRSRPLRTARRQPGQGRRAVYWSDGSVLSDDPAHFGIVSDTDHYLFTKDGRTVHVNGVPIAGADPATFRVLGGGYSQDADGIFYFTDRIPDADAASFERARGLLRPRCPARVLDGQAASRCGRSVVPRAEREFRMLRGPDAARTSATRSSSAPIRGRSRRDGP